MKIEDLNERDQAVLQKILAKQPWEVSAYEKTILQARKEYLTNSELDKYGLSEILKANDRPEEEPKEEAKDKTNKKKPKVEIPVTGGI